METSTEEFLAHYGVRGMKWGVKRNRSNVEVGSSSSSGSAEAAPKRKMSPETKRKLAIGAGVAAGVGAIALTAVLANKHQEKGKAAAAAQIQAFAKKSVWELAAELPAKPPANPKRTATYTKRDAKKDTKAYGEQGRARIEKRLDKGTKLADARKREALRQHGAQAARVALGINSAQRRDSKEEQRAIRDDRAELKRLRKQVGGR